MQEATRLAYLDAMDVTSWIPRGPTFNRVAPIASPATGRESEASPEQEHAAELNTHDPIVAQAATSEPDISRRAAAMPEQASMGVEEATAAPSHAAKSSPFYVQLWIAGPCALLLELPEPGLEPATRTHRLLVDILSAAGLPVNPSLHADFHWPLTRNPQFDRSAAAASQALLAFVQARLEERPVQAIGCLGACCALLAEADPEKAERLLGREEALEGLPPAWFAVDLERLLNEPAEKARLWMTLRRVMKRWAER